MGGGYFVRRERVVKLVFASNYFNHHQISLAKAFSRIYGDDYVFIAFTEFNAKRLSIGYRDMNQEPFVFRAYESPSAMSEAKRVIDEAECVIIAGMPVSLVSSRLNLGRITFMQSERFFKGPLWKDACRFLKYCRYSGGRAQARDPKSKFYLLCASAFAAWDYNACGLFRGKAYRWGYFPEVRNYDDVDEMISRKKPGSIIWVGRFLDWKHPDFAVKLASNLRNAGHKFNMKIIGSGEMSEDLSRMIEAEKLGGLVEMTGALSTSEVRSEMESAQIFIFTSDRGEGWGVVLQEAMNACCAVVAGEKIGSVPYILKDGRNGVIFRDRDVQDLTVKVSGLLREPENITALGRGAYETVSTEWNADEAAVRFVRLSEALNKGEYSGSLWEDGPGSIDTIA